MWDAGEAGVGVALPGGELLVIAADRVVPGRALAVSLDRTYRSGMLGYGPFGSAGWSGRNRRRERAADDADRDAVDRAWREDVARIRELAPRHILFLCVANSARSQMAEGIARSLAPEDVRITSAGSQPTTVRPQAVRALDEIGIDITRQSSKGMDQVDGAPPEVVITLCAEEACPAWLQPTLRVHWPLPDPAGAGESPEEEMRAFRDVRDELMRRLRELFA